MNFIKTVKAASILVVVVLLACCLLVDRNITGGWEGLYLLSGNGWRFEVTDDIFPEDAVRFIFGIPFGNIANEHHRIKANDSNVFLDWNVRKGHGSIKNVYRDGRKLLINLSRFKSLEGVPQSGIFLGGGLSSNDPDFNINDRNETGMAYFDGKRWIHIWCYVNEAIASAAHPNVIIGPEQWHFIDSRILEKSSKEITIESRHEAVVDGEKVEILKYLFYEAGNTYCTVVTKIINIGNRPLAFLYMYGDEPWLGDYGSSEGNVGWLQEGLVKTEQLVNVNTNTYAGFYDYGNDLAGEQHVYTLMANFIEWEKRNRPDSVYFSNFIGHFSPPAIDGREIALASKDSRFLGLQWKKTLAPKQSYTFRSYP